MSSVIGKKPNWISKYRPSKRKRKESEDNESGDSFPTLSDLSDSGIFNTNSKSMTSDEVTEGEDCIWSSDNKQSKKRRLSTKITRLGKSSRTSNNLRNLSQKRILKPTKSQRFQYLTNKAEIEGYTLGKCIGKGAFSIVRAASHNGKKVACKIIDKTACSKYFVSKFLPRELAINKSISHPNIVKMYTALELDNFVLFFLEYCEHGDLCDYIDDNGPIPECIAKHFFKQIISAVDYLHKKQIAHRDIKCENVLLAADRTVKLSDFGMSKVCDCVGSDTFCGSFEFLAPEVHMKKLYDPLLADIWAVGCLLYAMLTGELPFKSKHVAKVLHNQLHSIIRYPPTPHVSTHAKKVIKCLLAPKPERRATTSKINALPWLKTSSSSHSLTSEIE